MKTGAKKYDRFIQGTDCKSAPAGESNADLVNRIVQTLRCAYARRVNSIHIEIPRQGERVSLRTSGIDIYITPHISINRVYTTVTLFNDFPRRRDQSRDVRFDFGENFFIIVNTNQADEFERFIRNSSFDDEVRVINTMAANGESILQHALRASYCVLLGLNGSAKLALIEELYNRRTSISSIAGYPEVYSNLLLNLIRATSASGIPETQAAVLNRIGHRQRFDAFLGIMNRAIGLDNRDEFVIQLARLYREVTNDRYRQIDNALIAAPLQFSGIPQIRYVWRNRFGQVHRVGGTLGFVSDENRNNNHMFVPNHMIAPTPLLEVGQARRNRSPHDGHISYELLPLTTVYVLISDDRVSFADRGTILRMPAFQLAHLLELEQAQMRDRALNVVLAAATIGVGVTRFAVTNTLNRLIFMYSSGMSLLDIFTVDYQQYFIDTFDWGRDFVSVINTVNGILATRSALGGIGQLTTSEISTIEAMLAQWDIISMELDARQDTRLDRIREEMERLQSNLDIDEVIF